MSSSSQASSRKGKGRQKVAMEKIGNEKNLQVTFSKRHSGLLKKASELCTLTGAEVGMIFFSPSGKPFAFGHPDVNTVADRFLTGNTRVLNHSEKVVQVYRSEKIIQQNLELTINEDVIEAEKRRQEELEEKKKGSQYSFPRPIEELSYEELVQLRESYAKFIQDVAVETEKHKSGLVSPHLHGTKPDSGGGKDFSFAAGASSSK
ncbi:agamous-like MADS-box AGL62 [Olea europaea subsp. europaea]|uniref:Agamous-like MADS-box AGL62 n=1 Tax=Olea europaea subsp. europaea TaxID=158383 RepID=A0A8S0P8P0_OLEEU|nr:agamous-like MADS-box AGL62 [Olea europaea subsp. europaea]